MLEVFVSEIQEYFRDQRNRDIFNQGDPSQLIRQGEIDVLGLRREDDGSMRLYAVDIANHLAGLNLGTRDRTIARVLKKVVRSAASVRGYFPGIPAEVIFASPRVDRQTREMLMECIGEVNEALQVHSIPVEVRLLCNQEFGSEIVRKVVDCASSVADTSELFLRSVQLCQIAGIDPAQRRQARLVVLQPRTFEPEARRATQVPIGIHVQEQFRRLINLGQIPPDEIGRLQDQRYSKATFSQSYPVLKRHDPALPRHERQHLINGRGRYYADPLRIGSQHYYLCSQWEVRHRSQFDTWLAGRLNGVQKDAAPDYP
ncbi:MAG: hypothetical protein ABW003_10090 [Microvirga sp.]